MGLRLTRYLLSVFRQPKSIFETEVALAISFPKVLITEVTLLPLSTDMTLIGSVVATRAYKAHTPKSHDVIFTYRSVYYYSIPCGIRDAPIMNIELTSIKSFPH